MNFGKDWRDPPVQIFSNGFPTVEEAGYSLMCLTFLYHLSLPSDVPTPTFQWFFGPNGNDSLPSGVSSPMATSNMSNPNGTYIYTSTLEFPRLSQRLHTGMYTCRIGAGRLASNAIVTVNGECITS